MSLTSESIQLYIYVNKKEVPGEITITIFNYENRYLYVLFGEITINEKSLQIV